MEVKGFKSSVIFSEIQQGIKENPEAIKEFNAVLEFNLTDASGKSQAWTLDLKKGSVYLGKAQGGADCVLILSDENCFGIMNGTVDGTELFFDGALKIKGDMSLAMKLGSLKDQRKKTTSASTPAASSSSLPNISVEGFKCSEIFKEIQEGIQKNPAVVKDMGGVLEFSLTSNGKNQSWTLTPSPASLILGKVDKPDTIIIMSDEDCFSVMKGQKDSTELFFDGALKIKGDMSLAMKLGSLKESTLKANPTNGTSVIVPAFKSSTIFAEIEAGIKQNPSLVKEFDAVYEFALTSGNEKLSFTLDLKSGKVYAGKPTSGADVTLIMSDADCFEIMSGTKDSTELFFDGALKIKGDMSLAMKLGSLKDHRKVQSAAPATKVSSVNVEGFKSSAVFSEILNGLNESPDLVKEFGVVYEFKLTNASGKTQSWTVDLKDSKVVASAPSKSDCTIIMSDENCFNVMTGKADATELFFDGGLKVKGDMSLAMKLSSLKEKGIKSKL